MTTGPVVMMRRLGSASGLNAADPGAAVLTLVSPADYEWVARALLAHPTDEDNGPVLALPVDIQQRLAAKVCLRTCRRLRPV